ncbi:MAG: DUF1569 domain-containing protein [Bacteroidota bacterium]|nr:DUF1569 domain-containing protein [Bacteroidota bacterium]
MKSLFDLINELDNKTPFITQKNTAVSQVSIGWHLEHALLALVKMISAVENSNPEDYKKEFNQKRSIVLFWGKIPRGKAKVPDSVKPGEELSMANIKGLIEKAKQKVDSFEKLSSDKFFKHPVFGDLQIKQARKIIAIHTNHHLQIINDIISK